MVGAIFNSGLQLGSAIGLAVDSSIETSIEENHGGFTTYDGRAAAFWWLLAAVVVQALAVLIFYRKGETDSGVETASVMRGCADLDSGIDTLCASNDVAAKPELNPEESKAAHMV